ncbi:MAG: hypothetical protein WC869_03235 [Phycisphaerae bacterium]|jgi:predicted RNase H-like HicB family nuclease
MKLCVRVSRNKYGSFDAWSVELPGCMGRGENAAEAARDFVEASRGYLAALNNFVPEIVRDDPVVI